MACCIKCYDHEYELQYSIPVDLSENLFNDMSLMLDNKFIVGAHSFGFFSVTNLEEQTCEIVENPFGEEIDNIWGIETVGMFESEIFYTPTTNGLYECQLNEEGQLLYTTVSFFPGINVTNSVLINEDELLVSLEAENWNKMVILNLDT